jgi:hypothetical protein
MHLAFGADLETKFRKKSFRYDVSCHQMTMDMVFESSKVFLNPTFGPFFTERTDERHGVEKRSWGGST